MVLLYRETPWKNLHQKHTYNQFNMQEQRFYIHLQFQLLSQSSLYVWLDHTLIQYSTLLYHNLVLSQPSFKRFM